MKISKIWILFSIIIIILITPMILSQIIKLPLGELTIGDENAWVSFFGSYIGGVIGGLIAFGVAWVQINNLKKEMLENHRTYLSAATPVRNFFESKKINRREKHRILVTEDAKEMNALGKDTPYYSIVRFGGSQVVWDCSIEVIVSKDKDFIETDTIKAWIDFFEKDEEILIPLCSRKLNEIHPYIKDLTVEYRTEKNEKIKCYQSEVELIRKHYLLGKKEKLLNEINVNYSTWVEK